MEEFFKNEEREVKRPWQGTLWSILGFIRLIFFSFLVLFIFLFNDDPNLDYKFPNFFMVVSILSTILFFIQVVLIDKFLRKGEIFSIKVGIVLDILFSIFFILGFFPLSIFNFFMLYLSISCLKHPFYNQKNKN